MSVATGTLRALPPPPAGKQDRLMTTNHTVAENAAQVSAAIGAGQRLHIGVTLSYVGGSSDKFWTAVWAEDLIAINYGGHGHPGQFATHQLDSPEAGAAKLWALLRSKTGKGYAVVDAAVMRIPSPLLANEHMMVREWGYLRDARRLNPLRALDHPELLGTSPRTSRLGAQVLLDITAPEVELEAMVAAAVADPTERFLPPIVISRPDAPEEAKFMAALGNTTRVTGF